MANLNLTAVSGNYVDDSGGFFNSFNWLSAGERTDVATQRAMEFFSATAYPELDGATFSAALLTHYARYVDLGTPCTLRIRGVLGNVSPATSYASFVTLESTLTTAYVDFTQPAWSGDSTSGASYTLPDCSDIWAELVAQTGWASTWLIGFHITENAISKPPSSHITRSWHFRGSPAQLLPQWALNFTPADPGGGLPFHTSVVNTTRGLSDNFFSVTGGETITGAGDNFTGLTDAEIGGTPDTAPPGGDLDDLLLDAFVNDYWGKTATETLAAGYSELASGTQLTNLKSGTPSINSNNGFDAPAYRGLATHSPRTHTVLNRANYTIPHFPPSEATLVHQEGQMTILDEPGEFILDYYGVQPRTNSGPIVSAVQVNGFDVTGTGGFTGTSASMDPSIPHTNNRGIRAGGSAAWAGAIHHEHFVRGYIGHKLVCSLGNSQLKLGPVAPARSQDANGPSTYTGSNPMGTQFRIASGFNENTLSSAAGKVIAVALRDYGAVVMDRASGGPTFYATPESQSYVASIPAGDWTLMEAAFVLMVPS